MNKTLEENQIRLEPQSPKRSLNQKKQKQLKPFLGFPTGASDILIGSVNVFRFGIFVLKTFFVVFLKIESLERERVRERM